MLKADFGFSHVSTSSLLAGENRPDIKRIMDEGGIASDDIMVQLLEERLLAAGPRVYLDSLRSIDQICWLIGKMPSATFIALHLLVSEEEIARRIANAAQTSRGVRADDGRITRRLREYERYSLPMFPVLRRWTKFREINADQVLSLVLDEVRATLAGLGVEPSPRVTEFLTPGGAITTSV